MERVEAMVNPELLVWARKSAGLTLEEAANKTQVKVERLVNWEEGQRRPTINQLRKLGRAYQRPLAVFYLPKPPKDFQVMRDFRRLPGEVAGLESSTLRFEIRKARYRREVALTLLADLGETASRLPVRGKLDDPPDALAEKARRALGVTYQQQSGWRDPYEALAAWRAAVEKLGVLVFQASGIEVSEMRGFSLAETLLPVIVVNNKDHPHGRIFSLLHEFVHLMLRREGLCDLVEGSMRPPEEERVEVFCNRVAGAILLPDDLILAHELVRTRPVERWSDEELKQVARSFHVSREVVLRRLSILGKTTEDFYRGKRRQFLGEQAQSRSSSGGGPPPDRKAISALGPAFVRLVLNSFYQEKITSSDVSDYLEVRLKWMPKIEEKVFGRRQDVWALA